MILALCHETTFGGDEELLVQTVAGIAGWKVEEVQRGCASLREALTPP